MPNDPSVATAQQLKKISEIAFNDPSPPMAKRQKETSEVTRKDPGVATSKQLGRSKLRRDLEIAITRAERTLADADEASQEDEWGASERHYLASELKQMSAETRARAEAIEGRGNKTIREIHVAERKAARLRLEDLKAQLAKMDSEAGF